MIGRYIVDKLASQADWQVVGLSRRRAADGPRVRHSAVDLLDAADARIKLAALSDTTHVFYAAFQPGSGPAADYAKNISANRDLLVNSVTAIAAAAIVVTRFNWIMISRLPKVGYAGDCTVLLLELTRQKGTIRIGPD